MNTKEYLMQFKYISGEIADALEELNTLRELVTKFKASSDNGDRVMSSVNPDPMAAAVCEIVDMENEIKSKVDEMNQTLREIKSIISKVDDKDLRSILHKRYVSLKSWEQIAVEMNLSWRHTLRLHGKALNEVEVILKDVMECHT